MIIVILSMNISSRNENQPLISRQSWGRGGHDICLLLLPYPTLCMHIIVFLIAIYTYNIDDHHEILHIMHIFKGRINICILAI